MHAAQDGKPHGKTQGIPMRNLPEIPASVILFGKTEDSGTANLANL